MSGAAAQIAITRQSVASGAAVQASSIQSTAEHVRELQTSVQRNTDSATHPVTMTTVAQDASQGGNTSMLELAGAMRQIREAAMGTQSIIGDINQIAFQTNLPALNAAIEAARAGDHLRSQHQPAGGARKGQRHRLADG